MDCVSSQKTILFMFEKVVIEFLLYFLLIVYLRGTQSQKISYFLKEKRCANTLGNFYKQIVLTINNLWCSHSLCFLSAAAAPECKNLVGLSLKVQT